VTDPDLAAPIGAAFISKNPISYYAYAFNNHKSFPVADDFAREMEDSLVRSLVIDKDSTGIAHLKSDNTEFNDPYAMTPRSVNWGLFYFKQFKSPEWCYGGCGDTLIDGRDQQKYATVCIGEQVWMAENLNWAGAGFCYDNNSGNCSSYGRLYSITQLTGLDTSNANPGTVKGLCPEGWHVPSKAEFEELIAFCGGETQAADALRSTSGWPTTHSNSTDFDLKPAGHYTTSATTSLFRNIGTDAKLWTSSQDISSGFYYAVNAYHPNFSLGTYSATVQEWYFSCRCVKD
jgi:uncharacterized protein (TIGR02145 family)